jgi:hypothetical protein
MMEHNIHVKGMNIAPRVLYSHQRREWGITLVMGEDLDFFPVSPVNVIVMVSFQSTLVGHGHTLPRCYVLGLVIGVI